MKILIMLVLSSLSALAQFDDIKELKSWDLSKQPPLYAAIKSIIQEDGTPYFYIKDLNTGEKYQIFIPEQKFYGEKGDDDWRKKNTQFRADFLVKFNKSNTLYCKVALHPAALGPSEKVILFINEWSACIESDKSGNIGERTYLNSYFHDLVFGYPNGMSIDELSAAYALEIKNALSTKPVAINDSEIDKDITNTPPLSSEVKKKKSSATSK